MCFFFFFFFFFQAEDGIRDLIVTGVQTCALPISCRWLRRFRCGASEGRAPGRRPRRFGGADRRVSACCSACPDRAEKGAILIVRRDAESKENVDMTGPSSLAMHGSPGIP